MIFDTSTILTWFELVFFLLIRIAKYKFLICSNRQFKRTPLRILSNSTVNDIFSIYDLFIIIFKKTFIKHFLCMNLYLGFFQKHVALSLHSDLPFTDFVCSCTHGIHVRSIPLNIYHLYLSAINYPTFIFSLYNHHNSR